MNSVKTENISDKEVMDMLTKLGIDGIAYAHNGEEYKITNWWDIKIWLWNNFKMNVSWEAQLALGRQYAFGWLFREDHCECEISDYEEKWESPIEAEEVGIKNAIKFLINKR